MECYVKSVIGVFEMRNPRCWFGHDVKINYAVNQIGQKLVQGVSCKKCGYYQKYSIPHEFYQNTNKELGSTENQKNV